MSFIKYDQFNHKIAIEYGLMLQQDGKYHTNYNPENEYWSVLADYRDHTNCLVKFDPKDFS